VAPAAAVPTARAAVDISDDDDDDDDDDDEDDVANDDLAGFKAAAAASASTAGKAVASPNAVAEYDPRKREPLYSRAELTCMWELVPLLSHNHPSVSQFAQALRDGRAITYNGDPLRDFVLLRFLDKFVYKKPKERSNDRGGSAMQPKRPADRGTGDDMANTPAFLSKDPSKIPVHETFLHQYFAQRAAKAGAHAREDAVAAMAADPTEGKLANFASDLAPGTR
jgi:ribosome biogenesis protein MAK21